MLFRSDGEEVPPEWFGMNPDYGKDSAEVIDSSTEEEDEVEAEGEAEVPEDGAGGQPQLDRASSNEPRREKATTAGGDQTETARSEERRVGKECRSRWM